MARAVSPTGSSHRQAALDDATRRCCGFSLIEIVLVLAIMGIFAAMAAPRYGRASGRYRADLAARRIVADLGWAQSCARAGSSSRTMSFAVATEQYQLLNVPSADGVPGDYTVTLSAEPYHADLATVNFNGGAQVVFNGWGLPDHGGSIVVTVGSETRTITVDAETGRAGIQ